MTIQFEKSRDAFERVYSERTATPLSAVVAAREGDTYAIPEMATAWKWWQAARSNIVVPLAPAHGISERGYQSRCAQFVRLAGVEVAS